VHIPVPLVIVTRSVVLSIVHGPVVEKVGILVEFDDATTVNVEEY
jgi:hypothetical protein